MHKFYPFLFVAVAALLVTACNSRGKGHSLVGPDKLSPTTYTIDVSRDTMLKTVRGAILRIPQGALDAGGATTVRLEIKEAYSIEEMIRGGLVTRSNGEPLSSGGMIYIGIAGEETVRFKKAVVVSLPSNRLQEGMQLYKGKMGGDGVIDWVDPAPMTENPAMKTITQGKALFASNCAACHALDKEVTGPALGFITQRRDRCWLTEMTRDNQRLIKAGERYMTCLYENYNKAPMNAFPSLTDKEIDDLYYYIDNESPLLDSNKIVDHKRTFDSCLLYDHLMYELEAKRQGLFLRNRRAMTVNQTDPQGGLAAGETGSVVKDIVVPPVRQPGVYYEFTVETSGWYNVDIVERGLPGFEDSQLMVRLQGQYKTFVSLFLVLPAQKILLQGGPLRGQEDVYGFWKPDGTISLPQGAQAYILAMGEYEDRVVFGKTTFVTSRKQSLQPDLALTTREALNKVIEGLQIGGLTAKADDSQNASAIRSIDEQMKALDRLKPKHWNCCFRGGEGPDWMWGEGPACPYTDTVRPMVGSR